MSQKPKPLDDTVSVRAWWGVELRNWRRVRGLSSTALGKTVHLSGTSIERIEKDERPCNAVLAARLDDVLDAGGALRRLWRRVEDDSCRHPDADSLAAGSSLQGSTPASAGILQHASPTCSDCSDRSASAMERRAFLAVGGLAAFTPTAFTDAFAHAGTPLPARVTRCDVEQVRTASTTFAGWDNLYGGGGIVRNASIGQLRWARGLLDLPCPPRLRPALFTAVGHMAAVLGASAFDAFEHEDAAALLTLATDCAEQADDWHLRAHALNWRARHAIWCGRPDDGLTHAEQALVRADRLNPRERAAVHNARARALAKMGDRQATLAAIGASDDAFAHAGADDNDPPWMAYYDNAQHHGDTAHAAFDIAVLPGQSTKEASERFVTAINGHTDAYVRSRAFSGTKLATLTMITGDPREAAAIGHRALNEVDRLRSKRAAWDMGDLFSASASHRRVPEIIALRERIKAVVTA
ncbi:helix-turn-helix domain-containing protein [Embleya sp. NPDC008237]|uniref:helix-turn-helix domain-containing protein n=1 Tax=Embleya sp. NPDC008237 TaxID=3363978 RepID=UPI0036EFA4EA